MERKLAAILAADVVGYSRLMHEDEAGTFVRLKEYRQTLIEPELAKHRGCIFKLMGDGLFAEFASVVDAVECAVAVQRGMAERNVDVAPKQRIEMRIGINLGDVIVEGEDRHGDGVNIAARLQQFSKRGGVVISGTVYDHLHGKLDLSLSFAGEQQVKNIARPVRLYHVELDPPVVETQTLTSPDKPSLVVLPFTNMSGDPEQEYFSDGITEDLITDLSKVSGLFVIARNSAFEYKRKTPKLQDIIRELGVQYVLEGSVRKVGNRVRITAQLTDSTTGGHPWAERFDRDLTDIFVVQDEVTREIVSALRISLTRSEQRRLKRRGTDNLEAYEYYVRGRQQAWRHSREANERARTLLERALELDGNFASAHAALAYTHQLDYVNLWQDQPEHSLKLLYELARKAVALDDDDPDAHFTLGLACLWLRQLDRAITEARRALTLDPNFANGYALLAMILHYAGRSQDALKPLATGMRLDPHYTDMFLHILGQVHFGLGQYEDAIRALKRRIIRNPNTDASRILLAAACGHLERVEEARSHWQAALQINPAYSLEHRRRILPYKNPGDFERVVEGLRNAGLSDKQPLHGE